MFSIHNFKPIFLDRNCFVSDEFVSAVLNEEKVSKLLTMNVIDVFIEN